jgi:hypothetical protein
LKRFASLVIHDCVNQSHLVVTFHQELGLVVHGIAREAASRPEKNSPTATEVPNWHAHRPALLRRELQANIGKVNELYTESYLR